MLGHFSTARNLKVRFVRLACGVAKAAEWLKIKGES